MLKKLLIAVLVALSVPATASAQVFNQNQVVIQPYGGWVNATSTSGGAKLNASTTPYFSSFYANTGSVNTLTVGSCTGCGSGSSSFGTSSLSAMLPIVYTQSTSLAQFSITQAGPLGNGYLSSADWNSFNARLSTTTSLILAASGLYFSTTSSNAWSAAGLGFSTTSSNYYTAAGFSFSTTSSNAWSAAGLGFSTTSANYWKGVNNFFSTTSASYFSSLGLAFSTTSSDYWKTQRDFFSTSSALYFSSLGLAFSTTSANAWSAAGLGFSTTSADYWYGLKPVVGSFGKTWEIDAAGQLAPTTTIAVSIPTWLSINDKTLAYASSTNLTTIFGLGAGGNDATTSPIGGLNTAIGYGALSVNTRTGLRNTAVGDRPLNANTTGDDNTAVGDGALFTNTTGSQNTALGSNTLVSIDGSSGNVAVGMSAMLNVGSGGSNVAVGPSALAGSGGGPTLTGNTAVGRNTAVSATTGANYNAFLGYFSGGHITTGYGNTLIGASPDTAGENITSGGNNIGIGHDTLFPSATANNQLNIGGAIFGTIAPTSTTLNYPIAVQIGIGSTSPAAEFSIHANNGSTMRPLFLVGSSTANSTSTLFSVNNIGSTTLYQIPSSILKTMLNGTIVAAVPGTDYLTSATESSFSTTSALYFSSLGLAFSTTSDLYFLSQNQGNAFSTTSANFWSSAGLGFSTTSSSYYTSIGLSFSTTSNNYWETQQPKRFDFTPTTAFTGLNNNATGTLIGFNAGLYALASSTIGNGTATGGLTVSGNATTTGSLSVLTSLAVGTTSGYFPSSGAGNLLLYNTNTAGASPSIMIGGNLGGDSDFWIARVNDNQTDNDDMLQLGAGITPGVAPFVTWNYQGREGIGSSSPSAALSVNLNPTDLSANLFAFAIGSSTAVSTTTLFSVSNIGSTTIGNFGACSGLFALNTTANGTVICGAANGSGSGAAFPFTPITNFGTNSNSTGTLMLLTAGLSASSTVHFGNQGTNGFTYNGAAAYAGFGTTTPVFLAQFATGTGQQIVLTDNNPADAGTGFRTINGNTYISTTSPLTFASTSVPLLTLLANGNAGFGTSTPWAKLSVGPISALPGPLFAVGSSSFTAFVIDSTGHVGFGTTSPSVLWGNSFATTTVFLNTQLANSFASTTNVAVQLVNWQSGTIQRVILGTNTNLVINATSSNPLDGAKYILKICQDTAGSRTATFVTPGQLIWEGANGATTTVSPTAGSATYIGMTYDARTQRYDILASTTSKLTDTRSCQP